MMCRFLYGKNRDSNDLFYDSYCITYVFAVDSIVNYRKNEWLYEYLVYPYLVDTEETYGKERNMRHFLRLMQ